MLPGQRSFTLQMTCEGDCMDRLQRLL